ncbi:hydroxymethylglutaryl-CoA lyase [Taibaiella lutea]|uniref:Hydroxymethylglutaryl-CoA lyase n=1 Tax=Taibaiella lutea TaxID=2608001 RepID=A0A5M6CAC3_9BACT|nr:hydroxymethylglutaryl-CoA lyase [Taibaiella lutea]KAA5532117.1 hydroxymethylglutaryl-CoA lyase [Taibaiella lutea]
MSGFTTVECPRDAMQGWEHFIPTEKKIAYLNQLLKVGFDVLDFGSFVSSKAIPQLADTHEVVRKLDMSNTQTKLLAIIANTRGAQDAVQYDEISYLGFPFSISETFQLRNTNKTILESLKQVEEIQQLCIAHNKKLVIYISMGFGNPYGDAYSTEIAIHWFKKLNEMGIEIIAMSDTVGVAKPDTIEYIYKHLVPEFPGVAIGAHFHSTPDAWEEKLDAAYKNGCRRYDSSIKGIGGCPMAEDDLVGNIATENVLQWAMKNNIDLNLNRDEFAKSMIMANEVFI